MLSRRWSHIPYFKVLIGIIFSARKSQQAYDVKTKSHQRRCNVMTCIGVESTVYFMCKLKNKVIVNYISYLGLSNLGLKRPDASKL